MVDRAQSSVLSGLFQKGYGLSSLKLEGILNIPSKNALKVKQIP